MVVGLNLSGPSRPAYVVVIQCRGHRRAHRRSARRRAPMAGDRDGRRKLVGFSPDFRRNPLPVSGQVSGQVAVK